MSSGEHGQPPRTHEPDLRELTAELDGLRTLMEERNKWYGERDKDRQLAVDKALTAAKEATASAFTASKEAIVKAEESQKAYNASHNDLLKKLDMWQRDTLPRPEADLRFKSGEQKVEALDKFMSNLQGRMLILSGIWALLVTLLSVGASKFFT